MLIRFDDKSVKFNLYDNVLLKVSLVFNYSVSSLQSYMFSIF